MHQLSRLLSRTLVNGLYSNSARTNGTASEASACKANPRLVSAVAGFPKDFKNSRVRRGQIGDDAWLVANSKTADVLGEPRTLLVSIGLDQKSSWDPCLTLMI